MIWREISRDWCRRPNRWESGDWLIQRLGSQYAYPYEVRRDGEVVTYCETWDDARSACGDTVEAVA